MQVPIASSFLLSSRAGEEVWVEPVVDRRAKTIAYRIRHGGIKAEIAGAKEGSKARRAPGNAPTDVSAQKIGYDIASHDPDAGHLRFIEVKGRIDGADAVMITRQEVITSLHEPDKFILAIVQVGNGYVQEPRYVRKSFTQEPEFGVTASQVNIKALLERAEKPG